MTDLEYIEKKDKLSKTNKNNLTYTLLDLDCKAYNKDLIAKFPFLLPRNRWTDKVVENFNYGYTELDAMPVEWRKAFGINLCEELEAELEKFNYQDKYRISDIKEKYGTLCWYDFGYPKEAKIYDILNKYTKLSEQICFNCGKKAEYRTFGWIYNLCLDCFSEKISTCSEKTKKNLLKECKINN